MNRRAANFLVLLALCYVPLAAHANLLLNADFESNTGWGGQAAPWVDTEEAGTENWAGRNSPWGMALVTWFGDGNGFFYQDVSVTGGVGYTFSIWALRDPGTPGGAYYLEIEWYQGATFLGVASQTIAPSPDQWTRHHLSATAPAGATAARVFVGGENFTLVAKFDDAVFTLAAPAGLTATGADKRVDLTWNGQPPLDGYHVYRAPGSTDDFVRLTASPHRASVYSDFVGGNGATNHYAITAVLGAEESDPSLEVSAATAAMTDDELLTSVQRALFRYFWDYGHPVSGLIREGYGFGHPPDTCATGGTGFGLMALCVGAERGFVTRAAAAERVLQILTFLDEEATRYHGAWPHWIHGATGATLPFGEQDDGGDLIETAFLVQGLLAARQYFDSTASPVETEIRSRATAMWQGVDWYWYLRRTDPGWEQNGMLFWHWSPNYGWARNQPICGYHEGMITYLLAVASPTHPIPPASYYSGWTASGDAYYANGAFFYGYLQRVGPDLGGPMFFTHYSHLGFDPRDKNDRYADYFENSRHIALIDQAYCAANPKGFAGYSAQTWGLTASFNPWGYGAQQPGDPDNGTIAPTAAISSMPYTPAESIAALKSFYHGYGPSLWGPFGFQDAFNPGQNWYAPGCLAIDQGPMIIMIENHRSQLLWNRFMANPEIAPALAAIGWGSGKRAPANPANVVNGLTYEYYEGAWSALPDFSALTPLKRGSVANFDLSPRLRDDNFAFRFTGYLEVPANAGYTFYTESDDGSQLYVGDTLVVRNDGLHGREERSGFIALQAGRHPLTVTFFEQGGGEFLQVRYVSQTIPKIALPDGALFRPGPVEALSDGFETNFALWTDGGNTDWSRVTAQKRGGRYAAQCGSANNDLISDNVNAAAAGTIAIEFWYRDHGVDDDDNVFLQLFDGTNYIDRAELGITAPEDTWRLYQTTINCAGADAKYFRSNFRIKFEGTSIDSQENLWIDDVKITVQ